MELCQHLAALGNGISAAIPDVKICGLCTPEDVEYINDVGVEYAGFVLYEKSKRHVTLEQAAKLLKQVSLCIQKVAVTVSPDLDLAKAAAQVGFDILQVHGELNPQVAEESPLPIWRAFNCSDPEALNLQEGERTTRIKAYVVDGEEYGAGKTFDWEKNISLKKELGAQKLVLAGGLNSQNVAEGIRRFRPDVVDVSSGVEKTESIGKDLEKIKAFVKAVREE